MLVPADVGLPEKFCTFRPHQLEAAGRIAASGKRWFLLSAPTGSGKSLIAAAAQRLLQQRVVYSVQTIQLEYQLQDDFPDAVLLKGRSNYPCLKRYADFPHFNAAHCLKTPARSGCTSGWRARWCKYGCDGPEIPGTQALMSVCPCYSACLYQSAKRAALAADLAILNLPFLLTEANYVGGFGQLPFLVLDEADSLEDTLRGFIELTLTARQIKELGLQLPRRLTVLAAWREWAAEASAKINGQLVEVMGQLNAQEHDEWLMSADTLRRLLREADELRRLSGKLSLFLNLVDEHWVFTHDQDRWSFKPVFVNSYVDRYLWSHAQRFLCMSATLLNPRQWAKDLGVPWEEVEHLEVPMQFPVEHRRIHYRPAANLTYNNVASEYPKLVQELDRVLDEHPKERGLVHTVSYALARYILANSRHKERMVWHDEAAGRMEALDRYKVRKGRVLVSPSFGRGLSLDGDLGRFVVICKCSFPDLGDKQVAGRLYGAKDGQAWYATKTITHLVQASGRAVRSVDDWSAIYILDSQFERLYQDWRWVFPAWYRDAVVGIQ